MTEPNRDNWATPDDLMAAINRYWPCDLDVCASDYNNKCGMWYGEAEDGLAKPWKTILTRRAYCNPPGSEVARWVDKALAEQANGASTVLLVQAGIETEWYGRLMARSLPLILSPRPQFIPPTGAKPSSNPRNYIICILEPWMVDLGGAPMRQWVWKERRRRARKAIAL